MAWGQSGLLLAALAANGQFHRTCDCGEDFHSKNSTWAKFVLPRIIYYFPWQRMENLYTKSVIWAKLSLVRRAKANKLRTLLVILYMGVVSGDLRIKCLKGSSRALCLPFFNAAPISHTAIATLKSIFHSLWQIFRASMQPRIRPRIVRYIQRKRARTAVTIFLKMFASAFGHGANDREMEDSWRNNKQNAYLRLLDWKHTASSRAEKKFVVWLKYWRN